MLRFAEECEEEEGLSMFQTDHPTPHAHTFNLLNPLKQTILKAMSTLITITPPHLAIWGKGAE